MRSGDVLVDVCDGRVVASQTLLDWPRGGSVSARVVEVFSSRVVSGTSTKTTQKPFNYHLLFDLEIPCKQTIRV